MKAVRTRSARVHVAVKVRDGAHAAAVLRAAGRSWVSGGEELSIALVTDREMRRLNLRWRRQDRPTDVLSFPLDESGALGDVIISGFGFEWEAELMGAQGYIGKPFEAQELEATIANLLRPRLVTGRATLEKPVEKLRS